jgi:hypothetical protein
MRAVLVPVLLLAVPAAAPVQASQVKMHCEYAVPDHAAALEERELGGKVVRGALKSYCRADERDVAAEVATPELRYFSPVHLLPSGLCKARVSYETRDASDVVARQLSEHGRCPPQQFERYVDTTGITDAEFLALMRFWRDLSKTDADDEAIIRRETDPGSADMLRKQRPLKRWLATRTALARIAGGDGAARRYLRPEERGARVYVLEDTFALAVTVMAVKGGFEIVSIADQMP